MNKVIRESLSILNDKEREIIKLRYGFYGKPVKQAVIAEIYKNNQANISRIEKKAIEKLVNYLETKETISRSSNPKNTNKYSNLSPEEKVLLMAKLIIDDKMSLMEIANLFNKKIKSIKSTEFSILKAKDEILYNKMMDILIERKEIKRINSTVKKKKDNFNFELHKEEILDLMTLLDNSLEQTVLLLRFGYIKNKFYTVKEISQYINKSEIETLNIINCAVSNLEIIYNNTISENLEKEEELIK